MLILHNLEAWHWALGGACIGAITLMLLFIGGKRLGISTGFENVCSIVSARPYFRRTSLQGTGAWRFPFLAGLVAGGFLSAVLGGGWSPFWDLGMFDTATEAGPMGKLAWMFVGGLFIGFGTRLAGGCTSGHGIFGVANFEKSSWLATASFMAAGIVTTQVLYRFVLV
jgi:uncharacterized membrane protein YedE/YeeE